MGQKAKQQRTKNNPQKSNQQRAKNKEQKNRPFKVIPQCFFIFTIITNDQNE